MPAEYDTTKFDRLIKGIFLRPGTAATSWEQRLRLRVCLHHDIGSPKYYELKNAR